MLWSANLHLPVQKVKMSCWGAVTSGRAHAMYATK